MQPSNPAIEKSSPSNLYFSSVVVSRMSWIATTGQFRILFCLVVMSLDLPLIRDTVVLRCFYFHDFDIFEGTSSFLCVLSLSVDLLLPEGVGAS